MDFDKIFAKLLENAPHWKRDPGNTSITNGNADAFRCGAHAFYEYVLGKPAAPVAPAAGDGSCRECADIDCLGAGDEKPQPDNCFKAKSAAPTPVAGDGFCQECREPSRNPMWNAHWVYCPWCGRKTKPAVEKE